MGVGAPPPAFPCFVFRALITVLSSELPNEAVWISCCSGFPRPLKGQHRTRSGPGWNIDHSGEGEHRGAIPRLSLNAKGSDKGLVQYFLAALTPSMRTCSEVLIPEAGASELCSLVRAWDEREEEARRPGPRRKSW